MPTKSCDKLFVPPLMADAINHAVHNVSGDSFWADVSETD
jgi:hypothetical protein